MNPADRVASFRSLSPHDLSQLKFFATRSIFNRDLADEAFSHALAAATERYDGRVPLRYYLRVVARNFAATARPKSDTFSDLPEPLVESIRDPNNFSIDGTPRAFWVKKARAILNDEANDPYLTRGRRLKAKRACSVLNLLKDLDPFPNTRKELELCLANALADIEGKDTVFSEATVQEVLWYLRQTVARLLKWKISIRQKEAR